MLCRKRFVPKLGSKSAYVVRLTIFTPFAKPSMFLLAMLLICCFLKICSIININSNFVILLTRFVYKAQTSNKICRYTQRRGNLSRTKQSTMVKKCGKLSIQENSEITWPYTDRPGIRTTGVPVLNNNNKAWQPKHNSRFYLERNRMTHLDF